VDCNPPAAGHARTSGLLQSQLDTLEEADRGQALTIDIQRQIEEIVKGPCKVWIPARSRGDFVRL